MMSEYTLSPITPPDGNAIIDIFNYYIRHTFAAYPEDEVPYEFFPQFLETCHNYPSVTIKRDDGTVAGFGMLRAHNPMPVFRHTAEITCFLHPEETGKGLGFRILGYLETEGKRKGITTLLASISSLNDGSIRFHARHGFTGCGRFREVGVKNGVPFDTVWMQKCI